MRLIVEFVDIVIKDLIIYDCLYKLSPAMNSLYIFELRFLVVILPSSD